MNVMHCIVHLLLYLHLSHACNDCEIWNFNHFISHGDFLFGVKQQAVSWLLNYQTKVENGKIEATAVEYAEIIIAVATNLDDQALEMARKRILFAVQRKTVSMQRPLELAFNVQALTMLCTNPTSFRGVHQLFKLDHGKLRTVFEYANVQRANCLAGKDVGRKNAWKLLKIMIRAEQTRRYVDFSAAVLACRCISRNAKYFFLKVPVLKMMKKIADGLEEAALRQNLDGSIDSNVMLTSTFVQLMNKESDNFKPKTVCQFNDFKNVASTIKLENLGCGKHFIVVNYTLWIGRNVTDVYSLRLPIRSNTTFYQVMQIAAVYDKTFGFTSSTWPNGHFISEIAGHEQNKTTDEYWLLYKMNATTNEPEIFRLGGVDVLIPEDEDHILFWFKKI